MTESLAVADELGPWKVLRVQVPGAGLHAVLVVDNIAAGPAVGGIRMAPDVSLDECRRLARAMTLKNAAAGLAHGGGKMVVFGAPGMPRADKERLVRALACALRGVDEYIPGPDMGTDEGCMAWIRDETGRAVGLPRELGGIPLDEIGATGWGLRHAAEVACAHAGIALRGARVVVQGFGAVGRHAARFLAAEGAVLVGAADSRGAVHEPEGLDLDALLALKRAGRGVAEHEAGRRVTADEVVSIPCDIWIPAARPDVLRADNVQALDARIVLQGANIPATDEAERVMHERGIVNVPDFIANAGGVICAAMEYRSLGERAAMDAIAERVGRNTREVLETAHTEGITTRAAALRMAGERVRRAMGTRRWGIA